jgi:hypothetical protein
MHYPSGTTEVWMTNIPIAKTVPIREAGFDEYWLQEQIINNPSALDLGDLEVIWLQGAVSVILWMHRNWIMSEK